MTTTITSTGAVVNGANGCIIPHDDLRDGENAGEYEGGCCPNCGKKAEAFVCTLCGVAEWTITCYCGQSPRLEADENGQIICDNCYAEGQKALVSDDAFIEPTCET